MPRSSFGTDSVWLVPSTATSSWAFATSIPTYVSAMTRTPPREEGRRRDPALCDTGFTPRQPCGFKATERAALRLSRGLSPKGKSSCRTLNSGVPRRWITDTREGTKRFNLEGPRRQRGALIHSLPPVSRLLSPSLLFSFVLRIRH